MRFAADMTEVRGLAWLRYVMLVIVVALVSVPGIISIPVVDRDEGRYVQASKQMLETGDYIDIRLQEVPRYKKPVGIYWLQSAMVTLTGGSAESEVWRYRLVSVAGAALAVVGVAWTGTALFGATAGFAAGLFLALLFGVVFEAHIAKTDAMLLAAAVWAQGALARIYVAEKEGTDRPAHLTWLFWAAQGAGVLIKGPIVPLLSGLTIITLWWFDKDRRWLGTLNWVRGGLLAAVIIVPWYVAISIISQGAFWAESLGNDLLGKTVSSQESHGAPPGYYVLTYGLYVWPFAVPVLIAGLHVLNRFRSDPRARFLVAWYIPFWLVYEAIFTKLPHYVIPAYPALALAGGFVLALGLDVSRDDLRRWQRWLVRFAIVGQVIVTLGLAGLAIAGPVYMGEGNVLLAGVLAAAGLLVAGYMAVPRAMQLDARRLVPAGAAAVVGYSLLFGSVVPNLTSIWMSPAMVASYMAHRPCNSTPLISSHYHEPSLVFHSETGTPLVGVVEAAQMLVDDAACTAVFVADKDLAQVETALAAAGLQPVMLDQVEGIHYSKGALLTMHYVGAETTPAAAE